VNDAKPLVMDNISSEGGEEPTVLDLWNKEDRPGTHTAQSAVHEPVRSRKEVIKIKLDCQPII